MLPHRVTRIYSIFVFLFAVLLLGACILLITIDYNTFIKWIVVIVQKNGIENLLREKALTSQKFKFIQKLCYAAIALLPFLLVLLIKKKEKILWFISFIWKSIVFSWKGVFEIYGTAAKQENLIVLLLLLIIFIKSLHYIIAWDLQYDEMWCYNYFTAQPFYFSFFMYSNYPLYEVITHLFKWLPLPMKINLRLPVLLTGLLACFVLYACLKKYFKSHLPALAGMVLFAFMPVTTFYMLYARGVIFELFFVIAGLFSLLFWFRNKHRSAYLVIYILANVLGLYSMPTHVYYWLTLAITGTIVCFQNESVYIKKFTLCNLLVVLFGFVCYLPIWLASGFSFVTNATANKSDIQNAFEYIPGLTAEMAQFFTGFNSGFLFLILICVALLFFAKQFRSYRYLLIISIVLYLLPTGIYLLQKFDIPERAFAFTSLAIPLTGAVLFKSVETLIKKSFAYLLIFFLGLFIAIVSDNHSFLNWSRQQDREAIQLSKLFLENNITTCYDNSVGSGFFYYYPAIEYYYRMNNKTINFTLAASNSVRYKPLLSSNNYNCIVYKLHTVDTPRLNRYKEIFRDTAQDFKIMMLKQNDKALNK